MSQVNEAGVALVASGQIKLRRIDGWQKISAVLSQHTVVGARFQGFPGSHLPSVTTYMTTDGSKAGISSWDEGKGMSLTAVAMSVPEKFMPAHGSQITELIDASAG